MREKYKTFFGCSVVLIMIIILFIGTLILMFKPYEMCGNHLIESKYSPNKKFKVLVFSRDCGATTGYSTQISILNSKDNLEENDTGNIFVAGDNNGKANLIGEIIYVKTKWLNNENLIIEYDEKAQIFKNEKAENGIKVIYKRN